MKKLLTISIVALLYLPVAAQEVTPSPLVQYSTGSWTPVDASGAALTLSGVSASYSVIGNVLFSRFQFVFPANASSANNSIGGLPFAPVNGTSARQCAMTYSTLGTGIFILPSSTTISFTNLTGVSYTNVALAGVLVLGQCIYPIS